MKQYLDLVQHVMDNGVSKNDRTGTGTKSIFGYQMRFNLLDGFPLVTTKKLHLKSIIHELLWFLKGDTNIKYLQDNGFNVYPVNPSMRGESILGEKVFGNIKEIDGPVEIVDVFRPSNEVTEIAKDSIKVNAKVLWLQLNISNKEAKKIVETNDIIYIDNKCTKIEYEKYFNKINN